MNSKPRYRALPLGGSLEATFAARADGTTLVTSTEPLQPYPRRLTDRLVHWAATMPDQTLAAQRDATGQWRCIGYAHALHSARCIAQALLDLGLSEQRPVAILSDNDLEHLLLSLGAMEQAQPPSAPVPPDGVDASLLSRQSPPAGLLQRSGLDPPPSSRVTA